MPRLATALVLSVLLFFGCIPAYASQTGNTVNDSFNHSKKYLERAVYYDHRITIYCQAEFDEHKNITLPEGFITDRYQHRALRVEWEHAVPAENFGRAFEEWREGHPQCVNRDGGPFKGRKCAEKMNMEYRYMQSDMYNLFPSIGAVNAARSNFRYSVLPDSPSSFGSCPAKVEGGRFEPPDVAKGEVARAALYMNDTYPKYSLNKQQRQLFEAWNKMFPVVEWECIRAQRIEAHQKNENPWVKKPCTEAGLWNNN